MKSKADYENLKACYARWVESPDAKPCLDDLNTRFNGTTLKKSKVDGKIDPNASIAAAGGREVLLYIDQMTRK